MKKIFFSIAILMSLNSFAASGFDQLKALFDTGSNLDVSILKFVDEGIYVGRCFTTESAIPSAAFLTFRNDAVDTGPIQVDPDLKLIWGNNSESSYYDKVDVKDLTLNLKLLPAPMSNDGISREVEYLDWTVQFRFSGQYIVQRNLNFGEATSFCYYYQFRN
jgi:hypothetical protein